MRSSNIFLEGRPKQRWSFNRWLLAGWVAICLIRTVFALDPNQPLSQYIRDQWGAKQGFPGGIVYAIAETADGYLWIGAEKGLIRFDGLTFRLISYADSIAIPPGPVLGLTTDSAGNLWVRLQGDGLLRYRDGKFENVLSGFGQREHGISAMCRGKNGDVLLSALTNGKLRFTGGKFTPLAPESTPLNFLVISLAEGADGTVWMGSRDAGLFSLSKGRLSHIERGAQDKKINCLREWSEPVATREAVYTNLSPGAYRFRVIATNSEGLWNGPEAVIGFEIPPLFWQTPWFRLSAALVCALAAAAWYRLHMRRLAARLNDRFEERLAERTRIAQELHDTLLQGFISASMQLHVAVDQLPEDLPAKQRFDRPIQLMGQVIDEGRNTLRGLRPRNRNSLDLEQAFSRIRQEFAVQEQFEFRVIVEGRPRVMPPILHDEVCLIGREALVNAIRHSHGKNIEVEVEYAADRLRILVRDDGCGIDSQVLRLGRDGHWGLTIMRERAERIGARLDVRTSAAAGTEVELSIPSHVAFQIQSSNRSRQWFAGLFAAKNGNNHRPGNNRRK